MQDKVKNNDDLYQHLNALVLERAELVKSAINEYNAAGDSFQQKSKLNKTLLKHLEVILAEDSWDNSLFLRNLIQPYKDIYKKALTERKLLDVKLAPPEVIRQQKTAEQCEVFILLYQTDGYNLSGLDKQINMLLETRVTRPIYSAEKNIETVLRARLQKPQDSYLVAIINKDQVLQLDVGLRQVDRYEQPLIYLANNALNKESFVEYVHMGNRYSVSKGKVQTGSLL